MEPVTRKEFEELKKQQELLKKYIVPRIKRKPTEYNEYIKTTMSELHKDQENSGKKQTELMKIAANKWKETKEQKNAEQEIKTEQETKTEIKKSKKVKE